MRTNIEFFEGEIIDALKSGVYEISIIKKDNDGKEEEKSLYIGQSVWMLVRCSGHLYQFYKDPAYFGFDRENIEYENITLKIKILEIIEDKNQRFASEKHYINEKKPMTQSQIRDHMKSVEDKIKSLKDFLD